MSLLSQWTEIKKKLVYSNEMSTHILENDLPYIPLAYIQSTGTQYIDTGIVASNNITIEIKFKCTTTTPSYMRLWGIGSSARYEAMMRDQAITTWCFNGSGGSRTIDARQNFRVLKYEGNTGKVYVDGTLLSTEGTSGNTNSNLWLFRGNDRYSNYYLEYCKIWNGSALVRDFVPAKNSSQVVCLWDKITNQFFTNQGTGSFVPGTL